MFWNKKLFQLIVISVAIMLLYRLFFLCIQFSAFNNLTFFDVVKCIVIGLRFDAIAAIYCCIPCIVLLLFYTPLLQAKWYLRLAALLFTIPFTLSFFIDIADTFYFPFTKRRVTYGIINQLFDIKKLAIHYLIEYWYVGIAFILSFFLFYFLFVKLFFSNTLPNYISSFNKSKIVANNLLALVTGLLLFIILRGTLAQRPLTTVNANQMVQTDYVPLITTSTLSFIQSSTTIGLQVHHYLPSAKAQQLTNYVQQVNYTSPLKNNRPNFVIITWESFGRFFSGYMNNNQITFTPFTDSLMMHSFLCWNNYSCGMRSINGNIAINTSLPDLMNDAIVQSEYQANKLPGLMHYLKPLGYQSAFFHGATNGSFNLDAMAAACGYDNYFGLNEYPRQSDYDGIWGIADQPYLQYVAQHINTMQQPFVATVFTLSSHHPYKIPNSCNKKYKANFHPVTTVMQYTDDAIKDFFTTIKKASWFNNTIFIIVGDHSHWSPENENQTMLGEYRIPLLFYNPLLLQDTIFRQVSSHSDIIPSILHLVGYKGMQYSFGNSVFNITNNRYAVMQRNGVYQLVTHDYVYYFNGEKITAMYEYGIDRLLKNNLAPKFPDRILIETNKIKAIIQEYETRVVANTLNSQ